MSQQNRVYFKIMIINDHLNTAIVFKYPFNLLIVTQPVDNEMLAILRNIRMLFAVFF